MKPLILLTLILLPLGAFAEGLNIKPGLWEIQNRVNINGQSMPDMSAHMAEAQKHMAEMQKHMAEMPPEMQERMKAALSQNNHMGMTDKGVTVCMSQDQINRSEIGNHDPDNHCKTTDIQRNGDKTTIKMHCDAPHEADMTTEVTRINDTEWHSITHMTTGGRTIDSTGQGKWLKTDCGNLKPLQSKK
jgi:hypothetical protein